MSQLIDWPGIRAAAVVVGVREAARRAAANLPQIEQERFVFRVLKRSMREHWLQIKQNAVPASSGPPAKPTSSEVLNGSESLQNTIQEHGNATKTALAQAARRGAETLANAKGPAILKRHHALRNVTAAAAQLHGWDSDKGAGKVTLNVLSIGGSMSVNAS